MNDIYKTIVEISEATYTDKRSKFLAYAIPVDTLEEVKEHLAYYRKEYYDARHVCYAYVLGADGEEYRLNDDGEPSGTAGRPIYGAIQAAGLTNILLIVVRYFGGVKLGTSGLIVAYKTVARESIALAQVVERVVEKDLKILFEYPYMNQVMRIVKEDSPTIISQYFDNDCEMVLRIRKSEIDRLKNRLLKVDSLRIVE